MNWMSIDPAKGKMGVARWCGATLCETLIIKARGNKGAFYCGTTVCPSRRAAIGELFGWSYQPLMVVMEKGAGGRANIVDAQGWIRGYIQCLADSYDVPSAVVNVSEWRRVIKEDHGVSWPRDRDRKKALAVRLVSELYARDVCDDEADAVLIGRAAMRMGMVEGVAVAQV